MLCEAVRKKFASDVFDVYVSVFVAVVKPIIDLVATTEARVKIVEGVRPPVEMVKIETARAGKVDDDWFVLLDVAAKAPGILLLVWPCGFAMRCYQTE